MDDICKLAEILRNNGDKVLNNESKLTLSLDLLNNLNSSFNLIEEQRDVMSASFHVATSTSFKPELFCDLQFLHDFMMKSPSLKLTPSMSVQSRNEFINISKCTSLKLLEAYRVNINLVLGIQTFRKTLQYLICIRSIRCLKDVLEKCGADGSGAQVWNELKQATFTHNSLQSIDSSIEYAPWLSSLDLSRNEIEDAEILSCLSNLKYLNLGYNKLNKVPTFIGQICNRLQVFILCNNFIENIQGIMKLINLCELDLTENCLIEHVLLVPLSYLATLQYLNLSDNPLSYHPQHRTRTCCYLHMNTSTVKFVLDEAVINKTQRQLIGSLHPKHLQRPHSQTESLTASVSDAAVGPERNRRVRHAIISDDNVPPELDIIESLSSLFTITEQQPIETKRQLENLHKEYIKSLYIKSHSLPPDLDLQMSSSLTSTPYVTTSESMEKCEEPSDVYSNKMEQHEEVFEPSDDEELESGESNIFLASVKDSSDEIIVIITKTHLTEKDQVSMKGLGRFALDTLLKCNKIVESDVAYVYVEFDTARSNRSRYYRLADEERERFYERLRSIIDNKLPEKGVFIVYRCMKCSTQFAAEKQKTIHQQAVKCLSCDSVLVVEDDS